MRMYVICSECGENHYSDSVRCLDIWEDIHGRDNVYFQCPETGNVGESLVYINHTVDRVFD